MNNTILYGMAGVILILLSGVVFANFDNLNGQWTPWMTRVRKFGNLVVQRVSS